ncbi:LRR receptor-like serine/threonine-protein kinase RPK2, partial [Tanacetum coccineum]
YMRPKIAQGIFVNFKDLYYYNDLLWRLALKSIYEDGFEYAITSINNEYHMKIEISAWSGKSCAVYTSVKFCFEAIIQSWLSNLPMKGIRKEGEIAGSHSFLSRMDLHKLISSLVQGWKAVKDTWMISWSFTSNFCDHEEGNSFASSFPLKIAMLPNLEILWAPSVNIDGEFPRKWGDCRALKMVNLAGNHLKVTTSNSKDSAPLFFSIMRTEAADYLEKDRGAVRKYYTV